MNYYYDPASAGLEMLAFEDPNLSYEFEILAFWATKDGTVFTATDSGCSCPSPFEDYVSLEMLERVGSVEQAERIFEGWNKDYSGHSRVDPSNKRKLAKWVDDKMCPIIAKIIQEIEDQSS